MEASVALDWPERHLVCSLTCLLVWLFLMKMFTYRILFLYPTLPSSLHDADM